MSGTVRIGARAGSAAADGAQAFKAASAGADAASVGSKGFKIGDEVLDISQMGLFLKKMDGDTLKVALENPGLVKFLDEANPEDLMAAFKGIDDSKKLANIGEQMDPKTIDALKKVEGGADLAKKLKPSTGVVARAGKAGASLSKALSKKLQSASKSIKKLMSGAENPPKNIGDATEVAEGVPNNLPRGKTVDNASPEDVGNAVSQRTVSSQDDATKAVADTTKVLEDGSKSSKSLKEGLAELGITPGSVAIGAGVIVLLCMAYDTDNPFTAVDRALDDTGKVVKGFKEVADSAATAAKDVTTGGFDFISFVSNNSWISFACSILCVILLFALFMMGMLGSMGGNNKR